MGIDRLSARRECMLQFVVRDRYRRVTVDFVATLEWKTIEKTN